MLRNSMHRWIVSSVKESYRIDGKCGPLLVLSSKEFRGGISAYAPVSIQYFSNLRSNVKMPRPPPPPEDGLTRYPRLDSAQGILRGLDLFGTAVFSYSGCVTAGSCGMDLLGCTIVGTITAVGGGTVRDMLLGNHPVIWMKEVEHLWICILTSLGTFAVYSYISEKEFTEDSEILKWADALGVGAFCVIGAQNAVRRHLNTTVCIVCGMLSASFGGMIRDVLCQKPPRILHSTAEIYASTALAGSGIYMLLRKVKLPPIVRIAGGFSVATALRVVAWKMNIRLPIWAESPRYSNIADLEEKASAHNAPKVADAKN